MSANWRSGVGAAAGRALPDGAVERVERIAAAIHAANQRVNLTAAPDVETILREHALDALSLIPEADLERALGRSGESPRWIDIGAGGGFPGLPLAAALPDWRFLLIDGVGKKCRAMEVVAAEAGLANIEVQHVRAESLGRVPGFRESFSIATARAVASAATQIELAMPLLITGGALLLQKSAGPEWDAERSAAASALAELHAAFGEERPPSGFPDRRIIPVRKHAPTPDRYPRRDGVAAKRPLR